ncbi:MAG: CvpA family protein [Chitinophagaceae bacterium]|nr:CvpA family protein [Chitinophagaceae bacterium]
MNWVDISLVVVLLLAVWAGWKRGFILGSLDLLTWLGSIILGFIFYPYTAKGLESIGDLGAWLLPVAFILTTIIARIIIGFITRRILNTMPENAHQDSINRFFGMIPGAVNGLICATIIAALLLALPLKDTITTETRESLIASKLSLQAEWANKKLAPVFDQAVRQTMNSLTVKPGSHEEVKLHFTYEDPIVRPSLEAKMLEMVNKERAKEGLKPLQADREETLVARAHSKDMFARGYFAHVNPDGKDPFDRMKEANLKFKSAGENLALAQTLEIAHRNLMNSPGHRANIMSPDFGRVGIGIQDGGFYGLMISQEFRN